MFPDDLLMGNLDSDDSREWIVVYTKPRQEKALANVLYRWKIPFYLPLVTRENIVRGRKIRTRIPLFDGYLFIFARDDERIQALKTNRTVQMIPVEADYPLSHELGKIHKLIQLEAPLTVESRLIAGKQVRIKHGSMQGLEGLIISRKNTTRLVVEVSYIQKGVSIEIDDCMVEPI